MSVQINRTKLLAIHAKLKAIAADDPSNVQIRKMVGRSAGILGSWEVLKPGTLARFFYELSEFVKREMNKPRAKAKSKQRNFVKGGTLAGVNGATETLHWEGLPNGMERHQDCLRPETVDIQIAYVTCIGRLGVTIRIDGEKRFRMVPWDSIYSDKPKAGERDFEMTVALSWARKQQIREYL